MYTRFAKYERVALSFQKFFDQDELEKRLGRKADLCLVRDMGEVKADRKNLEKTNGCIDNLNERVKYLAVLQNELAMILEPIKNSVHNFDEATKKKLYGKLENI